MWGTWRVLRSAARDIHCHLAVGMLILVAGVHAAAADDKAAGPPPAAESAANLTAKPGFDIDGDPLPPGVIARLGTKRLRPAQESHNTEADRVIFLSDNKTLLKITADGWLQRWDAVSGRQIRSNWLGEKSVNASAASADGRLIAVGGWRIDEIPRDPKNSTNWFKLFDSATGAETLHWEIVESRFNKLALSPDGRTVAWGGEIVHILDVASQTEIASLPPQPGGIGSLTFTPDGTTLAIGQRGKLLFWNWKAKGPPRSIDVAGDPRYGLSLVRAAAFAPDGTCVAVGHGDPIGVSLHRVADGKQVRTFGLPEVDSWNIQSLVFSPDGKCLAAPIDEINYGGSIALWDVQSGRLIRRMRGLLGSAGSLSFSSDGQKLAALSAWDDSMCVWNAETGEQFGADLPGHVKPANSLRFFDQDRQLASASDDGSIRIWNLANSQQRRCIVPERDEKGCISWIRSMDTSPDGKRVVSSSFDDTVRVWDIGTGKEIYRLPGHGRSGGYRAVRFSSDGQRIASWGDDMRVYLWDSATGKSIQEFRAKPDGFSLGGNNDPSGPEIEGAAFSADVGTLLVVADGNIYRFAVATAEELPKFSRPSANGSNLAFAANGVHILATSQNPTQVVELLNGAKKFVSAVSFPVELWSVEDEKVVSRCEPAGICAEHVTFSQDGSRVAIAIGGDQPRVEFRTVPDLADAGQLELPSHAGALEFSASGKLLATSVADGTVLVWDLEHLPPQKGNGR
jgi:WD40 repeat protein